MDLAGLAAERLRLRNEVSQAFFADQADHLAEVCRRMAERFLGGGRLLAFGRDHQASDAQHVSVEFVHPVLVGKRALPALDLSPAFERWLPALVRSDDMVMGFAPPAGDAAVADALRQAAAGGALTFALAGSQGDYAVASPSADPYIHQEIIEILYHTLWETVHVFFEHRERGKDVGASEFLYPYLGSKKQDTTAVTAQVAASIVGKAAQDERLREQLAGGASQSIASLAAALQERSRAGATLFFFGNGGSATDANDWAMDCCLPLKDFAPLPAASLSLEAANATAIANDVGAEAIFARQLIAQGRPGDVAVAISTSGGSENIIAALEQARKQELLTVALLGYDGGEIVRRQLAAHTVVVESDSIPRIQEIHASIYHTVMDLIEATGNG